MQTLTDVTGKIYEHRAAFTIQRTGPITGWVQDAVSSANMAGVTVSVTQSDTDFAMTTGADGAFAFPLTESNVAYQVSATIGGVRQVKHVVAPTNGLIFRLPLPLIEVDPPNIVCTVRQGQDSSPQSFVVRNLPAASGELRYTVSLAYEAGGPSDWIVITNGAPLAASLAPEVAAILREETGADPQLAQFQALAALYLSAPGEQGS